MTTYSEIKKVGNDVYLENPGARLFLGATSFTINNNKLYHLDGANGKLKTGYFALIMIDQAIITIIFLFMQTNLVKFLK